jgi:unsaturated chondroitin disaccharide hydrolase
MVDESRFEADWTRFCTKARAEAVRDGALPADEFPEFTEDGAWWRSPWDRLSTIKGDDYDHGNWSVGFWFGTRWLSGPVDGQPASVAEHSERWAHLEQRAVDITTHDIGFLFHPAVAFGHQVGSVGPGQLAAGLQAADTLGLRFNRNGDYLQAFGPIGHPSTVGTSTMDTMMNLPLLWWAGRLPRREALWDIAVRHARSTARVFFRPDGSTYHLVRYDPISGGIVRRGTFQGSGDDSCWSRGQAWAVAGYAWAYLATGEQEFREVAEWAAEYFLSNVPDGELPLWDFGSAARENPVPDASAAAITALGLLILADTATDEKVAQAHRSSALRLLEPCGQLAELKQDEDGLLPNSCYSIPHGRGVWGATMWGDFYYGLALAIVTGRFRASDLHRPLTVADLEGQE